MTPLAKRLVNNVYESMWQGIRAVKPGATGRYRPCRPAARRAGRLQHRAGVLRHGIGRDMHEEPAVLHYGQPGSGMVLQEGMVFTIEPMINQGDRRIKQKKDGWTVVTRDKTVGTVGTHRGGHRRRRGDPDAARRRAPGRLRRTLLNPQAISLAS